MNRPQLLSRWHTNALVRYFVVGIWNTLFGVILLYALFFIFDKKNYEYELFVTYILGTAQSYSTQRILVWRSTASRRSEFTRFAVASIIQYILNAITLYVAVDLLKIPPNYGALPIILIVALAFYFVNRKMVFRMHSKSENLAN